MHGPLNVKISECLTTLDIVTSQIMAVFSSLQHSHVFHLSKRKGLATFPLESLEAPLRSSCMWEGEYFGGHHVVILNMTQFSFPQASKWGPFQSSACK